MNYFANKIFIQKMVTKFPRMGGALMLIFVIILYLLTVAYGILKQKINKNNSSTKEHVLHL